jgi:hypothetical protein
MVAKCMTTHPLLLSLGMVETGHPPRPHGGMQNRVYPDMLYLNVRILQTAERRRHVQEIPVVAESHVGR